MVELTIDGMTCGHCVHAVTEALQQVVGVTQVQVTLKTGLAQVEGKPDPEALKLAVVEEGYKVTQIVDHERKLD